MVAPRASFERMRTGHLTARPSKASKVIGRENNCAKCEELKKRESIALESRGR